MSEFSEIWREKHRLFLERSEELHRRMEDYDKEWNERMAALRARCAALGHTSPQPKATILGETKLVCHACGGTIGVLG